ncbi:hypothetical protein DAETH_07430 [Deinococcus aetherius]|uniref:Uncharacterized protein n=1 Tax=Deinococcus aetherius TaxID=200252 RepID=A0ABM8AAI9_9DEIO|nr:hypothetical protein [Deinococcus aetherius]BDP40774.1 hypothetical protein DAETH_07430 [Deinococcus aetherius]
MTRKQAVLLAAALSCGAAAQTSPSTQVVVRFGSLHWVDARGGAPRIRDARVVVPFAPACDLLGLTCKAEAGGVRVGERLIPSRGAGFVELRSLLEGHRGFTLTYDGATHMAVVDTRPNVNMVLTPWMRARDDWGNQLRRPYLGLLFALKTKTAQGVRYRLSATGTPLDGVTLLNALPAGEGANVPSLNVRGALTPSLPDNPNRDPGCGGRTFCVPSVSEEGLWMLAAVDAR